MKIIRWNKQKNQQLQRDQGIGFETVEQVISTGSVLDIIQHPNLEKYPSQRIFILEIDNYVYLVPFVENEQEIFLKTIIPSRKMKKKYLGE